MSKLKSFMLAGAVFWAAPSFAAGIEITLEGAHASGLIEIDLLEDVAPLHAARITKLAQDGFYDDVYFHRVIDGFMAQTGDGQYGTRDPRYLAGGKYENDPMPMPTRAGRGGSDLEDLPAEFSEIPFVRGVVGMARGARENSANSQFFIMFDEADFLNGSYTVVGRVTSGMELVDQIKRGDSSTFDVTGQPDYMSKVVAVLSQD